MPPAMRETAVANFAMAKCVHFGFEGDADSIVCKLYLERGVPAEEVRRARADNLPVLMHLAFKWDLLRDAAMTTRYLWRPLLTATEIEARLDQVYRGGAPASRDIANALLRQAIERTPPENLQFLECGGGRGDARRSFDLNVYKTCEVAGQGHFHPLLQQMREHFHVRPGRFQALYDQIKGMSLGHLAGGVHRDGKDFFNLYYGAVRTATLQ